jgi:tight adherence protein B
MVEYSIYFAIFVAAILGFEATAGSLGAWRQRNQSINRRLQILQSLPENSSALSILLQERGIDEKDLGQSLSAWLRTLWTQSGMTASANRFVLITTAVAAGLASATTFISADLYFVLAAFIGLAVAVPIFVLQRKRKQRIRRFTVQLPNALDVIVRSLRAGHPVASAISLVGREMPDPMGTEFGIVSDEVTYGAEMDDALTHLLERAGAEELRLLVTTISVQRSTGGNLAEILQNLSTVIRERIQMRARIHALSAEGRFTAWVMAFFPFVIYFSLRLITPNYFDSFWASPFVVPVLVVSSLMMIVGNYILFRMVNFDF